VSGDDLGVFLKEAQDLLGCGQLFAIEDAAASLSDPLLYKPHKVLQALPQSFGPRLGTLAQGLPNPPGLSTARFGDLYELPVSILQLLTGLLALFPGDPVQPLAYAPDAAIASAEGFLAHPANNFGR
jgi:hypothetical protein